MGESQAVCELCGEPMPAGEEMFKFHGYSGPCPKPPLARPHAEAHTPGPWVTNAFGTQVLTGDSWNTICELAIGKDHRLASWEDGRAATDITANARLIAAAPSLFEALKAAEGHLLNAKIDLETGTKKATTIATIEGGLRRIRTALESVRETA
jgi:hypothetical protein